MSEQLNKTISDGKGFFGAAVGMAENAVHQAEIGVGEFKTKAVQTVEDGLADVKQLAKEGERAAEGLVSDTAHLIKHDPLRSVGITFGVGLGLGIFAGWLLTRRTKDSDH